MKKVPLITLNLTVKRINLAHVGICHHSVQSSVLINSYTMATRDLPDKYAQAQGPQARGCWNIYQANPEWPWYK